MTLFLKPFRQELKDMLHKGKKMRLLFMPPGSYFYYDNVTGKYMYHYGSTDFIDQECEERDFDQADGVFEWEEFGE